MSYIRPLEVIYACKVLGSELANLTKINKLIAKLRKIRLKKQKNLAIAGPLQSSNYE